MKNGLVRVLSVVFAFAIILSLFGTKAGESFQNNQVLVPIAATAAKAALPAIQNVPEKSVIPEVPEIITVKNAGESADIQKVQEIKEPVTENNAQEGQTVSGIKDEAVSLSKWLGDFFVAFFNGMYQLSYDIIDLGGEFPEFVNVYKDSDDKAQRIPIGVYYDEVNKRLIGKGNQGAFGIGFDIDIKQKMMYASMDTWARKLGFCQLYDMIAPALGVKYKTERVKFEYAGLDWMVQIWKGSYFSILGGAEIGIYNKPQDRVLEFYDCIGDKDMLDMSMKLSKGDKVLFERAPEKHWWMNGFALSYGSNMPDVLTLDGSILFEDEGMQKAFLTAFDKICANDGITYTLQGKCVSFVW